MSKKSKVTQFNRNVNEEIRDQFKKKGEENMEEIEKVEGEVVDNKKGEKMMDKIMNMSTPKKIGALGATVAIAGTVIFGIYKIMTKDRVIDAVIDTDWEETDDTIINPQDAD